MSLNCSNVDIFLHVSHYAACCEFTASKWLRGVRDKTSMQLQILNVNERNKGCLCLNLWIRRFVFIFSFFTAFLHMPFSVFFFRLFCFRKRTEGWSWWISTAISFPAGTMRTSLMLPVRHPCWVLFWFSHEVNLSFLFLIHQPIHFFHLGFADHFDHIKSVIGAESIGIGGDFEGAKK